MKLFVYGTLKKNYYNNELMKHLIYVRDDKVHDFVLIDTHGSFPYMITKKGGKACGEVWEFDDTYNILTIVNMEVGAGYEMIPVRLESGDLAMAFWLKNEPTAKQISRVYDDEMWVSSYTFPTTTTGAYYDGDFDDDYENIDWDETSEEE